MALDGIFNTVNLESPIRTLLTMGIDAIILSKDLCDAWYQQSVRVNMGHVILFPIVRLELAVLAAHGNDSDCGNGSNDSGMIDVLKILGGIGITTHAKIIDKDAQLLETVTDINVNNDNGTTTNNLRWCCVLDIKDNGIQSFVAKACDCRIQIGMAQGVVL